MHSDYRRFKELRKKALNHLQGSGSLEARLHRAVCEIDMMRQDEIPKHHLANVKYIIDMCTTHKAEADEGIFRASINKMSYDKLQRLKNAINLL